ncbi:hypothetical protein KSP39_PZI006905 [Platanthera zijinensis]|uniref:COX assembly mitochondrial protein n=1 Tax=Platanthera zijinensis TaxID=2320716 RepID=A0AAP0BPS2_9ASPA
MNGRVGSEKAGSPASARCDTLHRALRECHGRFRDDLQRSIACRHLNRSLAECLVSALCPEEAEAVRSLCSSAGTSLKRSQCRDSQLALSVCLASHQEAD